MTLPLLRLCCHCGMWVGKVGVFKVGINALSVSIAVTIIATTMVNKTFIRNVNILCNVSHEHQHVHIHGVDVDHLVIIIVGYILLGISFIIIGSLIAYAVEERRQLMAHLQQGSENLGLY